jgi:hypothetical protein
VVDHLFKDDIATHMAKTKLTNKDADWIGRYQFSLNKVIESLGGDEEVSKKYGEMAKLWNGTELPDELKRK